MSDKYLLRLDQYERGLVIQVLNEKRNEILSELGDTSLIDDLLLKIIDNNSIKDKVYESR